MLQASVLEADASGRYDPLPVKVPVEALQAWHDAEAGLGSDPRGKAMLCWL